MADTPNDYASSDAGWNLPFQQFTKAWLDSSRRAMSEMGDLYNQVLQANADALRMTPAVGTDIEEGDEIPSVEDYDGHDKVEALAYGDDDWTVERSVQNREKLSVGDWVQFSKSIDEESVREFAHASGDTNRLHLDDEFASNTRFNRQIIHGTLVSGLISAALARLPGLTIYLSQDLAFEAPADIGDRLTAEVEVIEDLGGGKYRLMTKVFNEDTILVDGEAIVLIDTPPEADTDTA